MYKFTIFGHKGHETMLLERDEALVEFDRLVAEKMTPLTPKGDVLKELPSIPAEELEIMWLRPMAGG